MAGAQLKLVTWNVAGRTRLLTEQAAALSRTEPDLVTLQEIRKGTVERWKAALAEDGLVHTIDSGYRTAERRLFNLTASRWKLSDLGDAPVPQPERVVSAALDTPFGPCEIHNVHVPPAPSQGLAKLETLERLHDWLAVPGSHHRILCGDLNVPRLEYPDGVIETFASNHPPEQFERWDRAEKLLLTGLAEYGLKDVFRSLHGYESPEPSWFPHRRNPAPGLPGHRLDHVLASDSLNAVWAGYQHGWRKAGLSDHSALEVIFEPRAGNLEN